MAHMEVSTQMLWTLDRERKQRCWGGAVGGYSYFGCCAALIVSLAVCGGVRSLEGLGEKFPKGSRHWRVGDIAHCNEVGAAYYGVNVQALV